MEKKGRERVKKELEVYIKQSSKHGYDVLAPNYAIENLIDTLIQEKVEEMIMDWYRSECKWCDRINYLKLRGDKIVAVEINFVFDDPNEEEHLDKYSKTIAEVAEHFNMSEGLLLQYLTSKGDRE